MSEEKESRPAIIFVKDAMAAEADAAYQAVSQRPQPISMQNWREGPTTIFTVYGFDYRGHQCVLQISDDDSGGAVAADVGVQVGDRLVSAPSEPTTWALSREVALWDRTKPTQKMLLLMQTEADRALLMIQSSNSAVS